MTDKWINNWLEMDTDQLIAELKIWRGRALQNRAEARAAEAERALTDRETRGEIKRLRQESSRYRHRAKAAEEKLDALRAEHGPELVSFNETGRVYTGEATA